ncbi:MAG: glycosyltransferase family 39 protein [Patescibacteria group bacterium]|nr:glycosyltransferase family 39 protein [Patescibacteria group bacterium]
MVIENIKQKISWIVLIFILILSFILMFFSSLQESATMDELAHIPSGYSYVKFLDYRLNPEHPPLLKALSALPLLFLNLNFPINSDSWQKYVNGQWDVGREFLYESGNDADLIIQWSRIGPMLLTLFLIILIYIWSKELLGRWWALLVSFLFGLSPNVLAHGHLVTTDIAAAFGIVLATYFFIKFLYFKSRKSLILSGITFGIAQLLKFSTFMLIPYFGFLLVVFWLINNFDSLKIKNYFVFKKLGIDLLKLLAIFGIGYIFIVYPVYVLFTWNYPQEKQTADTEFILNSFAGGPTKEGQICNPIRCLAEIDILMTKNNLTRPFAHYLLGVLMVMQRSAGGNTAYFMGEISASGWKSYFPIVYLLKETLPFLIILFIVLIFSFKNIILNFKLGLYHVKQKLISYLNANFDKFALFCFIILYWATSISSPLNIGFRHLFPSLPFIYILTISSFKNWFNDKNLFISSSFILNILLSAKSFLKLFLKYILLFILLIWFIFETIFTFPYFLSYFNEFGGGIFYGYKYVTDSNYDWGQDLLRLKKFVNENKIDKIAVDYFGGGNPKYYLGDKVEYWWSSRGNPLDIGIKWLAVSVNTLQGAIAKTHPKHQRNINDEYRWLQEIRNFKYQNKEVPKPDFRIGTSIFVYKLTD